MLLMRSTVSIVVYNSETWTVRSDDKQKLRVFGMLVLRKICGLSRRDRRRIFNMDIIKKRGEKKDFVEVLESRRLFHVTRVNNDRSPHILLRGYTNGNRIKEDQRRSG